jgi:hypothetical protein
MRDTGSETAKSSIQDMLDKFLADTDTESDVKPVETSSSKVLDPGPVAPYVASGSETKPAKSLTR